MVGEQKELVRIRHGCALLLPVSLWWHSRPPKYPDYDQRTLFLYRVYRAVRLVHNVQGVKGMMRRPDVVSLASLFSITSDVAGYGGRYSHE
jgi:hypothetical protein